MALHRRDVLICSLGIMAFGASTAGSADEKLEGNVVGTNLTLCHPRPGGGGCEGTLTLETKTSGAALQMELKVIADTIIKKDGQATVLPATEGTAVLVRYVTEKGQRVAKSIDVIGPAQ